MSDKSIYNSEPVNDSRTMLNALRGNDENAKCDALQRLYASLTKHAAQRLGAKRNRVDVMPESIVQSVIVREVAGGGLNRVNDDQHLEARLKKAINNKVIDRGRKHKPSEFPVNDAGRAYDPTGYGPGPSTRLVNHEELFEQAQKMQAFRAACMAGPISDTQRRFVELSIFEEKSVDEIAVICGTSVSTIKVRLSEARRKLVEHLLQPLRAEVDGMAWAILDATLIQRKHNERAAATLGVNETEIRRVLKYVANAWLVDRYGNESITVFTRLLGNRKR
ncbi:MAG: sigma-70 family RNA polymerase sigma factor [Phycisphaerales bacterium]|nr:MAG: sigma-70 family RNA polymerase sigma factor [Phycisphaerales bacterium]